MEEVFLQLTWIKMNMVNWGVGRKIAPLSAEWSTVVTWDMFESLEDLMKYRVFLVKDQRLHQANLKMGVYNPDGFRNQVIFQPLKFVNLNI